jgi:hypothetical protein
MDDLVEMFGADPTNQGKLDPELQRSLRVMSGGWLMIHHPLVVEMGVSWKMQNQKLAYKKERLKKAIAEGDLNTAIFLHERPYRLDYLRSLWRSKKISLEELREELPGVWCDAEPDDTDRRWLTLWKQATKDGGTLVPGEGAVAPGWSDLQRIYRGGSKPGEKLGIAWTTDYEIAKFFALRFRNLGVIFTGRLPLGERALGYITERGESEVIVDPSKVVDITTATVIGRDPQAPASVVSLVRNLNEERSK